MMRGVGGTAGQLTSHAISMPLVAAWQSWQRVVVGVSLGCHDLEEAKLDSGAVAQLQPIAAWDAIFAVIAAVATFLAPAASLLFCS